MPGLSGTEPVFLNTSGFSSGMLKLYFCPRSWSAVVTALAAEARNACTAGRLCCSRWMPTAPYTLFAAGETGVALMLLNHGPA
jgi:hypothetical protein